MQVVSSWASLRVYVPTYTNGSPRGFPSPVLYGAKEAARLGPKGAARPGSAEGRFGDLDDGQDSVAPVEAHEFPAVRF